MNEKYFCLICGHKFDDPHKSENTGSSYCPKCRHPELLHESLKSKSFLPSLLDWLDPWHPATEPPEKRNYILDSWFSHDVVVKYYDEEEDQDLVCKGYMNITCGAWLDWIHDDMKNVIGWKYMNDLPPVPEKTWKPESATDGMRYSEQCDLEGGEADLSENKN